MENEIRLCNRLNCFNEITHMRKNAKYCCRKCKEKEKEYRRYWKKVVKGQKEI